MPAAPVAGLENPSSRRVAENVGRRALGFAEPQKYVELLPLGLFAGFGASILPTIGLWV